MGSVTCQMLVTLQSKHPRSPSFPEDQWVNFPLAISTWPWHGFFKYGMPKTKSNISLSRSTPFQLVLTSWEMVSPCIQQHKFQNSRNSPWPFLHPHLFYTHPFIKSYLFGFLNTPGILPLFFFLSTTSPLQVAILLAWITNVAFLQQQMPPSNLFPKLYPSKIKNLVVFQLSLNLIKISPLLLEKKSQIPLEKKKKFQILNMTDKAYKVPIHLSRLILHYPSIHYPFLWNWELNKYAPGIF